RLTVREIERYAAVRFAHSTILKSSGLLRGECGFEPAAHSNCGKPFTIFIVSRLTVITFPMSRTMYISDHGGTTGAHTLLQWGGRPIVPTSRCPGDSTTRCSHQPTLASSCPPERVSYRRSRGAGN